MTVGIRKTNIREPTLSYVARDLEKLTLGVQRLCVICPMEEQTEVGLTFDDGNMVKTIPDSVEAQTLVAKTEALDTGITTAIGIETVNSIGWDTVSVLQCWAPNCNKLDNLDLSD